MVKNNKLEQYGIRGTYCKMSEIEGKFNLRDLTRKMESYL